MMLGDSCANMLYYKELKSLYLYIIIWLYGINSKGLVSGFV